MIDFGLAKTFQKDDDSISTNTRGLGWQVVAAPEMDKQNSKSYTENYDERVDVWYLAVIFLILLSNNPYIIKQKEYWFVSATVQADEKAYG